MSKTRNQHKKYLQFMKQAGFINPDSHLSHLNSQQSLNQQLHHNPIISKTKRGRKKKDTPSQKQLVASVSKKTILKIKQIQRQQQHKINSLLIDLNQKKSTLENPSQTNNIKFLNQKSTQKNTNQTQNSIQTFNSQAQKQDINIEKQHIYLFPPCMKKLNNKIYGFFGHATFLTTKPIIQGSYFIEFNILPYSITKKNVDWLKSFSHQPDKVKDELISAVRVGIAHLNYKLFVPLGGQKSYALKGIDGNMINNKITLCTNPDAKLKQGDVIGIYLHLQPPIPSLKCEKIEQQDNKNIGSKLQFYKNGIKVMEYKDLDQEFYVFGISLFNWGCVQINEGPIFRYPLEDRKLKGYIQAYKQKIPYKDIKF